MIVEIEGYETEALVSGKKCTGGRLQWQMKKVIGRIEDNRYFVSLFCLLFDYEEKVYQCGFVWCASCGIDKRNDFLQGLR